MRRLALFALLSLGACSSCREKDAPSGAPTPAPSASLPKMTSGDIALANLNADVDRALASGRPKDTLLAVSLLLDRAHYLGKTADLTKAEEVVETLTRKPEDAEPGQLHYARATVAASLHRFDAALKELDQAKAPGVPATRASILAARGQYDEARELLPSMNVHAEVRARYTSTETANIAILEAKMQKPRAEWEGLFDRARAKAFKNVNPFPVAWTDFQHASLLELAGDDAAARTWFTEAVVVLPRYAHAAVHLAASEAPAEAIARLEKIRLTSDDPEVLAALASAHQRAGNAAAGEPLVLEAKKHYEDLVAKYPEAFADHAARFYLNAGNEPAKALELARLNAKNRPNEEALDLWMAAAAGAKNDVDFCLAVNGMAAFKYLSTRGQALVKASRTKCPDGGVAR